MLFPQVHAPHQSEQISLNLMDLFFHRATSETNGNNKMNMKKECIYKTNLISINYKQK